MTRRDRRIVRSLMAVVAAMAITGVLTALVLASLATLFPLAEDSIARDLRNGAGLMAALVLGHRLGRRIDRRWGGD